MTNPKLKKKEVVKCCWYFSPAARGTAVERGFCGVLVFFVCFFFGVENKIIFFYCFINCFLRSSCISLPFALELTAKGEISMSVVADNERSGQCGLRDHFCPGAADGIFPHHFVQTFPHERYTCELLELIMTNTDNQLEKMH